jgi:hypothetical protein
MSKILEEVATGTARLQMECHELSFFRYELIIKVST